MLISITLLMYQILCPFALFPVLLYFFNFIFLFFINNCRWRCWLYCSLNCSSLHLVSRSLLNTLCIIHPSGSSSWNASRPISFEILKGPYLFWSNFFKDLFKWIFLFSSHMLSPIFNLWEFLHFLSNCFFILFWATSINFVASSQLLCNPIRNSSNFRNSICATRLPFHGCLPKLSLNGVHPVATYFLSLYWNSAATSHSV